jgi:hypothetical protein
MADAARLEQCLIKVEGSVVDRMRAMRRAATRPFS